MTVKIFEELVIKARQGLVGKVVIYLQLIISMPIEAHFFKGFIS